MERQDLGSQILEVLHEWQRKVLEMEAQSPRRKILIGMFSEVGQHPLMPDPEMEQMLRDIRLKAVAESQGSALGSSAKGSPGTRLAQIAEAVFAPKFFERVLEPTLRDMAVEYTEASTEGRQIGATWALLRGYGSLGWALLAQVPVSLARLAVTIWRAVR